MTIKEQLHYQSHLKVMTVGELQAEHKKMSGDKRGVSGMQRGYKRQVNESGSRGGLMSVVLMPRNSTHEMRKEKALRSENGLRAKAALVKKELRLR